MNAVLRRRRQIHRQRYDLRTIFRGGTDGFIFTPRAPAPDNIGVAGYDQLQQWQESTGVTPVLVAETACGLRMDNSQSMVRGTEKATATYATPATFDNVTTPLSASSFSAAAGTTTPRVYLDATFVVGRTYEITGRLSTAPASGTVTPFARTLPAGGAGVVAQGSAVSTIGSLLRVIFVATATNNSILWVGSAAATGFAVDGISVKEVPGNHAIQATAAARPVLSQRVNQLLATASYAAANWTKRGTATVGGAAPDGTGESLSGLGASATNDLFQTLTTCTTGVRYEPYMEIWPVSVTGTLVFANPSGVSNGQWNINMALLTPGQWNTITRSHPAVTITFEYVGAAGNGGGHYLYASAGAPLSLYARRPDLRLLSDTLFDIPRYQRVNTATDYDTVGFPAYDKFDGTDDSRTSATGGGSTTGFFWCGVVTVLGGAGTIRTLFSDVTGNTGLVVFGHTTDRFNVTAGNGAARGGPASTVPIVVGSTYVVSAWYEAGILYVQVNDETPVASAMALTAGTAGFTEGKNNTSSSQFENGRMYGRVYTKDYNPSATQREQIKRELARQACCSHLLA